MKVLSNKSYCQSLRGANVATGCVFTNTNNVRFLLGGDIVFSASNYPSVVDGYKLTLNTDYGRYYNVGDTVLVSFVTNSGGYSHFIGTILSIPSYNELIIQSVSLSALIIGSHLTPNLSYEGTISSPNLNNIVKHIYLKTSLYATDKTEVSSVTLNTTRFYSSVPDALNNTTETTAVSVKPATLISSDFDKYSSPVYIGIEVILDNQFYDTVTLSFASHFVVNCTFGHNFNKLYFMTQTIENTHYGVNYPQYRQYAHLATPIPIETPELSGLDTYKFSYEFLFSRENNNDNTENSISFSDTTTLQSTPYFNEKFNSQSPDYEVAILYKDIDFNTLGYTNTVIVQLQKPKVPINLLTYNKDYITFFEKKSTYNPFIDTFEEMRIISKSRDTYPVLNNNFVDFYNYVSTPIVQNISFTPVSPNTFTITFEFNPSLYNTSLGTFAIEGVTLYYVNEWIHDLYTSLGLPNASNALQSHIFINETNQYYIDNLNSKRIHFANPIMYWNSRRMVNMVSNTPPYQFNYGTHGNTAPLFANTYLFSLRTFYTLKDGVTLLDDTKVKFKQVKVIWVKGNDEFFTNPTLHPLVTPKTDSYFYTKQFLDELIENAPILYQTVYDVLSLTGGTGITYQGLPQHPDTEIKRFSEISDANAMLIPNYEFRFGRDTAWTAFGFVSPLLSSLAYLFTSTFYELDNESQKNIPNRSIFLDFSEDNSGHNQSHPHYQKYNSNLVNDYQVSANAKQNLVFPIIVVSYDYDGIPFTERLTPLHYSYHELTQFKTLNNCYPACVYHDKYTNGIYDYFVVVREPISSFPDADPQLSFATSLGTFVGTNIFAIDGDTMLIKATNPLYLANIATPVAGFPYTNATPTILGMTLLEKNNNRTLNDKTCMEYAPIANQFVQDSNGIDIINPYTDYEIKNLKEGEYYLYVYIGKSFYKAGESATTVNYLTVGQTYAPDNPINFSPWYSFPPSYGILDVATMRFSIKVSKTISNEPNVFISECCEANFIERFINVKTKTGYTATLDDTVLLFLNKTLPLLYSVEVNGVTIPLSLPVSTLDTYKLYLSGSTVIEDLYAIPLSVLLGAYYNNPTYPCVILNIPNNPSSIIYNEVKIIDSLCLVTNRVSSNSFLNHKGIRMYGKEKSKQKTSFINFMQKDDEGSVSINREQVQLNRVSELYNYNKTIQRGIDIIIPNYNVVHNYIDIITLMQENCTIKLVGVSKYGTGDIEVTLDSFSISHYGNSSFGDIELNFKEKYNTFVS